MDGHNQRIQALIAQSMRDKKRSRRGISSEQDYVPALYEADSEEKPQITYIMGKDAPWPINEALDIAMFNIDPSLKKKYIHKAALHLHLRRPPLSETQLPIRIDVYERFLNGTVSLIKV